MKLAIEDNNGTVTTFGNVEDVNFNYHWGKLTTVDFSPRPDDDGADCVKYTGDNARASLVEFFGFEAVMKGERIPKSAIRKGDLIRMVDHSIPLPGDRDYRKIEYVATANGDEGYQFSTGERFYLLHRPKIEMPTAPGSVVRVRVRNHGVQKITLGKDGMWRGRDVHADAAMVKDNTEILEVIA